MARETINWTADSGKVYDNEFDALKDDLRGYMFAITNNEAISRDIVEKIASDLPESADILRRLNDVRPRKPSTDAPVPATPVFMPFVPASMMPAFHGTPRPFSELGARARCMGGSRCSHRVGQCTADPEYQARIKLERGKPVEFQGFNEPVA